MSMIYINIACLRAIINEKKSKQRRDLKRWFVGNDDKCHCSINVGIWMLVGLSNNTPLHKYIDISTEQHSNISVRQCEIMYLITASYDVRSHGTKLLHSEHATNTSCETRIQVWRQPPRHSYTNNRTHKKAESEQKRLYCCFWHIISHTNLNSFA